MAKKIVTLQKKGGSGNGKMFPGNPATTNQRSLLDMVQANDKKAIADWENKAKKGKIMRIM